ncbi:rhomboid family intramembrane serine protease [Limnobacter parvus]|uniref:Rhomboid family intramembrane serine protease n=1 Tax=Limnobacter parvus TaxID=2939690 RepID=A0ABT1XID5_9BURK|nr:rhomboid family intramembrane serine protease [Limnobacter parvus]MCR2746343.1 rhomboid family intramembrane serine protease [Limnobacter parvus]
METIRNYNATSPLFLGIASSLVIGIAAVFGQVLAADFPQQGLDLIDSFFIYALLAQFTHLGWAHLGLNLAGLAMLTWGFASQRTSLEWTTIQAVSLVWVAVYLAGIEPLDWYCGLSGALHFQFTACLVLALQRSPRNLKIAWPLWAMALGLIAKLALEWNLGHSTDSLVGGPVAYEAHRGGALGGLVAGVLFIVLSHFRKRDGSN